MDSGAVNREVRTGWGLTQPKLADHAGTTQSAVAAYGIGRRIPTVATIERLLGAPVDLGSFAVAATHYP